MSDPFQKTDGMSAAIAAKERRREARYSFSATAEAIHIQTNTRLAARVSDLSRGGCYVDTINPFPVGADLKLRFTKDNTSFAAEAKVFYAVSGMGMGVEFTKIEPDQFQVLERWIAQFGGEPRPEADSTHQGRRSEGSGHEQGYVLTELIIALMRKRVLTDAEGEAMLQRLLR